MEGVRGRRGEGRDGKGNLLKELRRGERRRKEWVIRDGISPAIKSGILIFYFFILAG